MPKYVYTCTECKSVIELVHSMNEEKTFCEKCEQDSLERVPGNIYVPTKFEQKKEKVGEYTKRFIENSKEELENQKSILRDEIERQIK